MTSPLLRNFDKSEDVHAIRVTFQAPKTEAVENPFDVAKTAIGTLEAKPGNRLSIKVVKIDELLAVPVESVEEAEQWLFDAAQIREVENVDVAQTDGRKVPSIIFEVNRSASFIAMRTRRGAGNVVLLGADIAEIFKKQSFFEACEPEHFGQWVKIGMANNMTFYQGGNLPANEAIISYVNPQVKYIDGPGGLIKNKNELKLVTVKGTETTLGNLTDYIQRVIVTNL